MLRLTRAALAVARAHAEAGYPAEACGLLLGRAGEDGRVVVRALPVANASSWTSRSYLIPARVLAAAEAQAEEVGLGVIGTYHSHPDGRADPSPTDLEHAWPWYTYLILPTGRAGAGEPRAWRLAEDRGAFLLEELSIVEDE